MKFFTGIRRNLSNTLKQIKRGGWISLASTGIMTLAFLLLTIFLILVFISNLFLQSIEKSPHIYVFFNVGTEENEILDKQIEWEQRDNIEFIEYTSEEDAKEEFAQYNRLNDNPLIANEIQDEDRSLPASLAIRLVNIDSAQEIIDLMESEKENNESIYDVRYSRETINNIRDLFFSIRIGMGIILALLIIVILSFTLLTVEFRTYSRAKEIEIMQLVGGSLWYIRMPFILEGAIYGMIGAILSNLLLIGGSFAGWFYISNSDSRSIVVNIFSDLEWPELSIPILIVLFLIPMAFGIVVGALNSLFAILRYIK